MAEEYAVLRERLRSYELTAAVVADIESYRAYWQRHAYGLGVTNAQMHLGVPVEFTTTPFDPFVEV